MVCTWTKQAPRPARSEALEGVTSHQGYLTCIESRVAAARPGPGRRDSSPPSGEKGSPAPPPQPPLSPSAAPRHEGRCWAVAGVCYTHSDWLSGMGVDHGPLAALTEPTLGPARAETGSR